MAEMGTKKALSYEGLKIYDTEIKKKISADDASNLANAKSYTDTKVQTLENGAVKKNTDAIAILNGTGVGSVSKAVADAIAKIVAEAPEAYDTLKEISDWITSHASSASEMNSQIQTNKTDIANLKSLIGTLPEDTEVTTIIEYIDSVVSGVDFTSEIQQAKQEAISSATQTASTDATSKANKALNDAKAYADGLGKNYATSAQGTKADTALQKANITSGVTNGSISVSGTDVAVKGLGSSAYTDISQFDAAGTATTKVNALANGQVATNKTDITSLKTKVETLEANGFVEITEEEILSLFN